MNRREFLFGAAALPSTSGTSKIQMPVASLTTAFLVDSEIEVQMRISAHLNQVSAEAWRKNWNGRAFEHEGEWYLQSTEFRMLPEELASLPADMQYYEFLWGEAAEEDSILAGTFRHDYIACVIRIWGDYEPLLIELGEWFASRPLPAMWELLWSDIQMETFVPTTEEFGRTIDRHDNRFWF